MFMKVCTIVLTVCLGIGSSVLPTLTYAASVTKKAEKPISTTTKSDFVAEGYNETGLTYARQHFYELARENFAQAVALAETKAKENLYNNNLAMTYKFLGNYEEALKIVDKVLDNDANFAAAVDTKGDILIGLKRYQDAVVVLTRAIVLRPGDGTSYYTRGVAREGLKQMTLAKADYKKAVELPGLYQKEAKAALKRLK